MVDSVRICAFKLGFLKKAITAKRKEMKVTGPKKRATLMELLDSHKGLPGVAPKMTAAGIGFLALLTTFAQPLTRSFTLEQHAGIVALRLAAARLQRALESAVARRLARENMAVLVGCVPPDRHAATHTVAGGLA